MRGMRIERAATFGIVGTIGIIAISLATFGLAQKVSPLAGDAPILMIGVAGTAVNLMFLFAVIGVFVDRKLEARGIASPEE